MLNLIQRYRTPVRVTAAACSVAAVSLSCADISGTGFLGSILLGGSSLVLTLTSLAPEFGSPGARSRVHGSGLAFTGLVVAILATHGGDGLLAAVASCCACGGLGAVIGDALSGARPAREAYRLALSTGSTVGGFLIMPLIAAAVGG